MKTIVKTKPKITNIDIKFSALFAIGNIFIIIKIPVGNNDEQKNVSQTIEGIEFTEDNDDVNISMSDTENNILSEEENEIDIDEI